MNFMAAGIVAALFAFVANRFYFRIWHNTVILGAVPLVEEVAKTITAYIFSSNLVFTHFTFGLTEGVLDLLGQKQGSLAAMSAVVAHSLFGWATQQVISETGNWGYGILAGTLLHAVWNTVLVLRTAKR